VLQLRDPLKHGFEQHALESLVSCSKHPFQELAGIEDIISSEVVGFDHLVQGRERLIGFVPQA
jgi:hypothetical protein